MAETSPQEQERATAYLLETLKQMQEAFQRPDAASRTQHLEGIASFLPQHRNEITNLQTAINFAAESRKGDTAQDALHHTIDAGFSEKYKMQDATARELLTDMLFLRVMNAKDAITAGKADVKTIVQGMLADAKIREANIPRLSAQEVFSKILLTDLVKKSLPQEGDMRRVSGAADRKAA